MAAGKSTFVDCLYHRRLPREILESLPDNAPRLPLVNIKYPDVRLPPPRSGGVEPSDLLSKADANFDNLILHCAVNKLDQNSVKLKRIIDRSASDVYVVTLLADKKKLARQYLSRMLTASRYVNRRADRPIDVKGLNTYVRSELRPRKFLQVLNYRWTRSVAATNAKWRALLWDLPAYDASGIRKYFFFSVEPCLDAAGNKNFRLVHPVVEVSRVGPTSTPASDVALIAPTPRNAR